MAFTQDQSIIKIKDHIQNRGGVFKAWLVGTAKHAGVRLRRHGVKRKGDAWVYVHTDSPGAAQGVLSHFIADFSVEGKSERGGDYVYAYKKNSHTRP